MGSVKEHFRLQSVCVLPRNLPLGTDRQGFSRQQFRPGAVIRITGTMAPGHPARVAAGAVPAAPAAPAAGAEPAGETMCLKVAPHDKVEDAYKRVDRVLYGNQPICTCVRVHRGVVLAPRHSVAYQGKCLDNLRAFNSDLEFVGARPDLNVAVFTTKGKDDSAAPAFRLAAGDVQPGDLVHLLSYHLAVGGELGAADEPALEAGTVSEVSGTGQHAAMSFQTAVPQSSGGAVLKDSRTLVGLYMLHLESLPDAAASTGSSSRAPAAVEKDPCKLWDQGADPVKDAATSPSKVAEVSHVNIQQKSTVGLFVPASALWQFLQALGLAVQDPLQAASVMAARMGRKQRAYEPLE